MTGEQQGMSDISRGGAVRVRIGSAGLHCAIWFWCGETGTSTSLCETGGGSKTARPEAY
jgi:hypothetical protein